MSSAHRPSDDDRLIEADPADREEQDLPADPSEEGKPTPVITPRPEVPEADAVEQAVEVPTDDDEGPR